MIDEPGTVYLIHFERRYRHAGHYIGWARDLNGRLWHHRHGTGARLMQVLKEAGIGWEVVRTWEDEPRSFERKLKNRHDAPRLCPICRAKHHSKENNRDGIPDQR